MYSPFLVSHSAYLILPHYQYYKYADILKPPTFCLYCKVKWRDASANWSLLKQEQTGIHHRIIWVGGDLKGHLVLIPCPGQGYLPLDQLSQGPMQSDLEHIPRKNFFPVSSLNIPSFNLKPLLLVLQLHIVVKSLSIFPVCLLQVLESCYKVFLKRPLLHTEQPQLSAYFHRRAASALWSYLWPPLDMLQ